MPPQTPQNIDVVGEILGWSSELPVWQRDALRRLVSQGTLEATDLDALTELCKAAHGLANAHAIAPARPIDESHVPQRTTGRDNVTLVSKRSLS